MASASKPSANEPAKVLIHTVQLKPMIKAHYSGRMVSCGISDVAFASVQTRLKKLIMIIIIIIMKNRKKRLVLAGARNGLPLLN